MSIIIGLTGPTGSGKSTASKSAAKIGFKVIDCDKVARAAVQKGTEGLKALINAFGNDILNADGTLDRKALAKKAFGMKENTELLNKTLLPHIVKLIKSELNSEKILLDAPTLFESGMNSICTATVAVLANKDTRLKRITGRDGIDVESAMQRINAGKPDKFYIDNADYVLYNDSDENEFIKNFNEIISGIKGKI